RHRQVWFRGRAAREGTDPIGRQGVRGQGRRRLLLQVQHVSKTKAKADSPTASPASHAKCRHFGDCGGCQIQDLEYGRQLEKKSQALDALFEPTGWRVPIDVRPSPDRWYYRNKMEFSFQDVYPAPPEGEDHLLLGLKRRQRWDKVLNLAECHL